MKKGIIVSAFLIFLFTSLDSTAQDFGSDYDDFVMGLFVNDSASVRNYFETEDMYKQCSWEIFQKDFVEAIMKVEYSDLVDDYMAGEKIKQYDLKMPWEMEENGETVSGVSTIIIYFKETSTGLKMIDFMRPEGTDAP